MEVAKPASRAEIVASMRRIRVKSSFVFHLRKWSSTLFFLLSVRFQSEISEETQSQYFDFSRGNQSFVMEKNEKR